MQIGTIKNRIAKLVAEQDPSTASEAGEVAHQLMKEIGCAAPDREKFFTALTQLVEEGKIQADADKETKAITRLHLGQGAQKAALSPEETAAEKLAEDTFVGECYTALTTLRKNVNPLTGEGTFSGTALLKEAGLGTTSAGDVRYVLRKLGLAIALRSADPVGKPYGPWIWRVDLESEISRPKLRGLMKDVPSRRPATKSSKEAKPKRLSGNAVDVVDAGTYWEITIDKRQVAKLKDGRYGPLLTILESLKSENEALKKQLEAASQAANDSSSAEADAMIHEWGGS